MSGNKDIDDSRLVETVGTVCAAHGNRPADLIEILHDLQEQIGYVPEAATQRIASVLNLSRAEVHGVISFYHDFRREPPGRHMVHVCRAEACQAVGCEALAKHAETSLGVAFGETRGDGKASLEAVYCLGNCALGPSVMIDGELHGRVDAARFDALMNELS
jgi:formate dehydrogenase subunit gamma